MKKILKYKRLIIRIAIIPIVGSIGLVLCVLVIKNHYGDLQEIYYESQNGDLIVNKTTFEFGIIEKKWLRASVKKDETKTDLYDWVYKEGNNAHVEIYTTTLENADFNDLNYSDIVDKINSSEVIYITGN